MPLCFVIGPIGTSGSAERKHSDLLLHAVIKEVLEKEQFGYSVKRADEDADPGMIGDRIITDIINAELVVADLSNLNPNVFYELGIRHSTEKPTIHIAKSETILPFDNISHRTIFVDLGDWQSIEGARARLESAVKIVIDPKFRTSNPITQANASFKLRSSHDPKDQIISEMQDRISSIESSIRNVSERTQTDPITEEIAVLIGSGKNINAIQAYRSAFPTSGLKQAKDVVEAIGDGDWAKSVKLHAQVADTSLRDASRFISSLRAALGA